MTRRRNTESGQGFILAVMGMTLVASTIALFTLETSQRTLRDAVESRRNVDINYALAGAARWLQQIYYNQSNCDPYVFNMKINGFPNRTYSTTFGRNSLDTTASALAYLVSVGEIRGLITVGASTTPVARNPRLVQNMPSPVGKAAGPPVKYYSSATGLYGPQDVSVTYWVKPFGSVDAGAGGTRYEQTITLMNTCSPIDPAAGANAYTPWPPLGSINDASNYSTAAVSKMKVTNTSLKQCRDPVSGIFTIRGSIDSNTGTTSRTDVFVLQHYLRSADTSGTDAYRECLDMNADGQTNDVDLNVLQKSLKGYLFYSTPSTQQ